MSIKKNAFAKFCYAQNSIEELTDGLLYDPDQSDLQTWGLSDEEWREQVKIAIEAKYQDLRDQYEITEIQIFPIGANIAINDKFMIQAAINDDGHVFEWGVPGSDEAVWSDDEEQDKAHDFLSNNSELTNLIAALDIEKELLETYEAAKTKGEWSYP